jgi:hypothetical protein
MLDPQAFRGHLVSLYQSAVETVVRRHLPPSAPRPGLENDIIRAGAQVATFLSKGITLPTAAPPRIPQDAWDDARIAFDFLKAKAQGREGEAAALASDLAGSNFDPNWAETLTEYVAYFGVEGARKQPQYIAPAAGMPVLSFKPGAVIGLLADWGIGTSAAIGLAEQLAAFKPDVVIHLGDIYYSGTPEECRRNFLDILNRVFDRSHVAIYNLSGNHDMYCGGVGFYRLLGELNPPPLQRQPASFFCLRSTDSKWQFIAMDTGRFDDNPIDVTTVLVRIEPAEQGWLTARIREFPGRTILLSHHQLFSAFNQIGAPDQAGKLRAFNPNLKGIFDGFVSAARQGGGEVAAWFWGHEHTLGIYAPYLGLAKGRCIGHGAIPVLMGDGDHPLANVVDPPTLLSRPLGADGPVHAHGFALLRFGHDGSCQSEYYNDNDRQRAFYVESLGGAAV